MTGFDIGGPVGDLIIRPWTGGAPDRLQFGANPDVRAASSDGAKPDPSAPPICGPFLSSKDAPRTGAAGA